MNKFYLGIAVLFASTIFAFGQADTQPQNTDRRSTVLSRTNLGAELQSTLDVRSAKVGDEVVLKTVKAVKQNGKTLIPKGASLVGRVIEAQRKTKENGISRLGMVFDRIEGKNLSAPISATVVTITDVRSAASLGDSMMADTSGSASSSASGSSGGLLGGGLVSTVGGVTNTAGQTLGTAANEAGRTVGTVTGTTDRMVGSTTALTGQTLQGIQLSSSAGGSASGSTVLSSQGKNVRLEKGVTFHMAVRANTGN